MSVLKENLILREKSVWILLMSVSKEKLRSFSDFINKSAWLLLMIVLKENPRSLF